MKIIASCVFVYFLSMQPALSSGSLMCYYTKFPVCFKHFVERTDGEYCLGVDPTIRCTREKAQACDLPNSTEVEDIVHTLTDVCREGTQLHEAYLQHKSCIFSIPLEHSMPCYSDFKAAIRNYPHTGNKKRDTEGMFRMSCRYLSDIAICLNQKVLERCGEEAASFHRKFTGPSDRISYHACMESGKENGTKTIEEKIYSHTQVENKEFHTRKVKPALSSGSMMCYYTKFPVCLKRFVERTDGEYCLGMDSTIQCARDKAMACDVTNSTEVEDIVHTLTDVCREGTPLHEAYLQHKSCIFSIPVEQSMPCYRDFKAAIQNYPRTGNTERDTEGMFRMSCRYLNEIAICLNQKVLERCGGEAASFHRKFSGPSDRMAYRACMESGSGSYSSCWVIMLQVAAFLFSFHFYSVSK